MTTDTDVADAIPARVCAECAHVNDTPTDYCLYCGAPLGFGPQTPAPADGDAWSVYGVASPFVGREQELDRVVQAIHDAVQQSRAVLVVLTGPEGAGRTRFLDRLNERVVAEFPDALMPKARVRSDHEHPYAPFAELLKERFYIPQDASPDVFRDRLSAGVRALLGPERAPDITHRIGAMLGLPDETRVSGGDDVERGWRRALVDVFRADASRQPLVLAFDDVDRAGGETRALVRSLVPSLADAPVVFLATARSLESVAATVGDFDASSAVHVALQPLADTEIEAITRELLVRVDNLPELIIRRVTDAALGNPLVAEEAIRILIREDIIDTRGNTWTVDADRLDEVALPAHVEDMVRARLELLTAEERQVLQHASLIGNTFWLGAVQVLDRAERPEPEAFDDLLAPPDDAIEERLTALIRRDVLRESPHPSVRGEREFSFKHDVERRLHAAAVPDDDAKSAHRLIAQWLQVRSATDPEPFLVAIAEHHAAGEMPAHAAEFYARAGRLCANRYVNDRALLYLESAAGLLPESDLVQRSTILGELGKLYLMAGRNTEAITAYSGLARAAWKLGSSRRSARAFAGIGRARRALGDYDAALVMLLEARERFESTGDHRGFAQTLDDTGRVHWIRGEYDRAEQDYKRALTLRRELGDATQLAASLSNMGTLQVYRGQFQGALEKFREALELRRREGDLQGIAESLNTIGYIFAERGDAPSAARIWNEAVGVAREAGDRSLEAILLNNLGEADLMLGQLGDAELHLRQACEMGESTGDRRVVFDAIRNLGVLQSRKGNSSLALDHADEALDMAKELGSRAMEGTALRTIGELRGNTVYDDSDGAGDDLAAAAFKSAIEIFRDLKDDAELGKTYHAFGTYLLERRQLVQGKKHLEMAREIFARLEMRKILAQTEATIHEL